MNVAEHISPQQCGAARVLLGWEQVELSDRAGVSRSAVQDFERGKRGTRPATLAAITRAFEVAGVRFLYEPGPGVQLVAVDAQREGFR